MGGAEVVWIAIAVLGLLVGAWIGFTYNRLVALRLACESSWSQIDVALKLRHDLVPALAESVAGYAGHEQSTLLRVSKARSDAVASEGEGPGPQSPAERNLVGSLGRMFALAEQYPALRASENFASLQDELAGIEEKIAITRRVYNDTVETYNTATSVFPPAIVARAFNFRPRPFFEAPASSRAVPEVELAGEGTG
jgi:LemA protein